MAKERFLTILVPITSDDCEPTVYASEAALILAVPPSASNADKVYALEDGTYRRSYLNPSTSLYAYREVVDREFPYLGKPLEIYDFTYDATRMGTAPTISASGVMWYAESDGTTLDGLWSQRCHVSFNGENFYIKQIPTSSKSNEDARYKYDIDFVAERVVLEDVYFYDVVSPFVTEKPISESSTFQCYGDINELAKRVNASLIRSGLATLTRKYVAYPNRTEIVPYLSYEQWNQVNVDPQSLVPSVFVNIGELNYFRTAIYAALDADYNRYLMQYIYVNDNGVYALTGYQCVIGTDKKGEITTSDDKQMSFDNNTIYEALQQFHDVFEKEYYITKEKDSNGDYTGNTLIVVGDCEHDFADWDEDDGDYVRDDDGIPTTDNPFDYGVDDELLMKEKTNTTDKIVTRITGVGGTENIPWYYPNPNPDGWLKPLMKRNGVEQVGVTIDYPTSEGSTIAQSVRYEKFLKNRLGNSIKYGRVMATTFSTEYTQMQGWQSYFQVTYDMSTYGIQNPRMTLEILYQAAANCTSFVIELLSSTWHALETYDSTQTYENPTAFQSMCASHDGKGFAAILQDYRYVIRIRYNVSPVPTSQRSDYDGYHYPSATVGLPPDIDPEEQWYQPGMDNEYEIEMAHVGENFYDREGLVPYASDWYDAGSAIGDKYYHIIRPMFCGYSTNGESGGHVSPFSRFIGKNYKDLTTGTIYRCNTEQATDISTGTPLHPFTANPPMEWTEWLQTFVYMDIDIYKSDGWYVGNTKVELADYGLGTPMESGEPYVADVGDAIEFKRLKYVTPQPKLMPEVYIRTDGQRRCYNAHNYWDEDDSSLYDGTADYAIGEEQVSTKVRNPIYKENETDTDSKHYDFESEYDSEHPHEHIENFDDEKPTIAEQRNQIAVSVDAATIADWANQYQYYYTKNDDGTFDRADSTYDPEETYYRLLRIDVVDTFAYDDTDNDEIWENNDNGSIQGDYKHPYFFAKLRPLGFNIFDLALQEDMVLSMTTGDCGACNFKIGVDSNSLKNPVQLWEHDVYNGDDPETNQKVYSAGELRRYVDLNGLYYLIDGEYQPVKDIIGVVGGGMMENYVSNVPMFERYVYSNEEVEEGYVGTMQQDGKVHFEGDVVTNGHFIESQQDTSENYVWVALMKDTDTYGTLMPAARPYYDDHQFDIYIRPKSIADVHTQQSSYDDDEDNADKFVLLNIKMPQLYLRRAERDLSRRLVAYMYDNNYQKFNFSIKFSRIYIEQNPDVDGNLNENSVLYVTFNGKTYRQYVKHYSYRMSSDEPLPELSVDMNEELSVARTVIQQWSWSRSKDRRWVIQQTSAAAQQVQDKVAKHTVNKNDQAVASIETVVREKETFVTLQWGEF